MVKSTIKNVILVGILGVAIDILVANVLIEKGYSLTEALIVANLAIGLSVSFLVKHKYIKHGF